MYGVRPSKLARYPQRWINVGNNNSPNSGCQQLETTLPLPLKPLGSYLLGQYYWVTSVSAVSDAVHPLCSRESPPIPLALRSNRCVCHSTSMQLPHKISPRSDGCLLCPLCLSLRLLSLSLSPRSSCSLTQLTTPRALCPSLCLASDSAYSPSDISLSLSPTQPLSPHRLPRTGSPRHNTQ